MEAQIKDCDLEECRLLRAEILQYLEEYQKVRDMMYAVTGTLLGVGIGTGISYLLLLPLIVIIPSYFIAIDYQKCVHVAATYIKVFYESQEEFPIKWETRKVFLDGCCFGQKTDRYILMFDRQLLPYKVCAIASVALYFCNWWSINISSWINYFSRNITFGATTGKVEFFLGVLSLVLVSMTVFKFEAISYNTCWKAWEEIQKKEQGVGLPTDSETAIRECEHYMVKINIWQKIRWILKNKRPDDICECDFSDFIRKYCWDSPQNSDQT